MYIHFLIKICSLYSFFFLLLLFHFFSTVRFKTKPTTSVSIGIQTRKYTFGFHSVFIRTVATTLILHHINTHCWNFQVGMVRVTCSKGTFRSWFTTNKINKRKIIISKNWKRKRKKKETAKSTFVRKKNRNSEQIDVKESLRPQEKKKRQLKTHQENQESLSKVLEIDKTKESNNHRQATRWTPELQYIYSTLVNTCMQRPSDTARQNTSSEKYCFDFVFRLLYSLCSEISFCAKIKTKNLFSNCKKEERETKKKNNQDETR